MEFLVRIRVELPPAMSAEECAELIRAERERGRDLLAGGQIQGIWRVPGGTHPPHRLENVGIWKAADRAELDQLIGSLPVAPWLTSEVTPLADHPLSDPEDD